MKPVSGTAPDAGSDVAISGKAAVAVSSDRDSDSDSDWHADVRESIREAASDAAEAARDAAEAFHESMMEVHAQLGGAIPPLPPMTGGKVVAGTLNGGGVEIQAATLTGDIRFKKAD